MNIRICIHTRIHTHHTRTHARTHTDTHTHTHARTHTLCLLWCCLLQSYFYVTESSVHHNRVFYYRKPVWRRICKLAAAGTCVCMHACICVCVSVCGHMCTREGVVCVCVFIIMCMCVKVLFFQTLSADLEKQMMRSLPEVN